MLPARMVTRRWAVTDLVVEAGSTVDSTGVPSTTMETQEGSSAVRETVKEPGVAAVGLAGGAWVEGWVEFSLTPREEDTGLDVAALAVGPAAFWDCPEAGTEAAALFASPACGAAEGADVGCGTVEGNDAEAS